MKDYNQAMWKQLILSVVAGVVFAAPPVMAQLVDSVNDSVVRTDNRGPGSLNSGPGSVNSGRDRSGERGRRGNDDVIVAQNNDVRQEDRREDRRSNAGGVLRGLDRADQVAGEHGREGRENARAVQSDRPNRGEQVERPQRAERPERPQRPERPEKPERAGRH